MYYRYINFLTRPTATYMKREIVTAVVASLALLILLNISPRPPQNATSAPQSPALPVVKLSELERLSPSYLYAVPAVLTTPVAAVPLSAPVQEARAAAAASNLQVAGVDEEDYVKFDGENLYVAAAGRVYVVGPDLAVKASAPCPAYDCVVFVWGGRLLTYGMGEFGFVKAYLYRLPDVAKAAEFNFSGVPIAARMAEGYVYIVAAATPPDVVINGARVDKAPLLSLDSPPAVLIVVAVDMERGRLNASAFVSGHAFRIYMKDGRLYIAATQGTPQLLYKAAVKAWDRLPPDVKAKLDLANPLTFYKSLQELLRERGYADDVIEALNSANVTTATGVYIFDLDGLNIRLRAAEVPGRLLDQFAIEELDGHLVVATTAAPVKFQTTRYILPMPRGEAIVISQDGQPVTTIRPQPPPAPPPTLYATEGDPSNSVYVLTPDGRIAGALEGLAPGERIYAARLLGKTLYLVTFRQVDPLFAIDLSNPAAPRVLGFLKIPGFSEYLHPVDADRLLGVGAYERGLKIALFDISNPAQPREVSNITATGLHSPVFYDHHAFAYSPELRLAMVPAASWYGAGYVLAVEVRDKLALRAVVNATADRAFFGRDAIYLVGRLGGVQIWKYATDLRLVAEARLS
jgi:inhibitor of cysteine peptidase